MKIQTCKISGLLIIKPDIHQDARGFLLETWNRERYVEAGIPIDFVQDNLSKSSEGVLRGLHFQHPHGQGKLVQVLVGEIWDVAVDLRWSSPTFAQHVGVTLNENSHKQFYVPAGFAHGFCVLSKTAIVSYKCSEAHHPDCEKGIAWNDPKLAISWPIKNPIVSEKDSNWAPLASLPPQDFRPYE